MNRKRFEHAVDQILEELPPWVIERIDNLVVVVEERPGADQDQDLLGLYEGVSLPERSADYWGTLPDQITIFRQPHVDMGLNDSDLTEQIRTTVLHEIGHYLGLGERRLEELGWD